MRTLCLVRHGIAAERGAAWPDDGLRPLTPDGIRKMDGAARGLAKLVSADVILTSPLVRARQTAEIVARAMPGSRVRVCDALATGEHERLLAAAEAGGESVVAVGHEPHISMALSWLLCGDEMAAWFDVKKGSAALVRFDRPPAPGEGTLEWLLPPRVLREVAGRG
jgi:phosphohistidine phosphatase